MAVRGALIAIGFMVSVANLVMGEAPASAPVKPAHLLLVTQSKGFVHDVVKRKDDKPCKVEEVFAGLAGKSKLFTVEPTQDASVITPEKLKETQVVVFYTTGDLPITPANLEALEQWIKDGGAFLGIHSATDTFHGNAQYLRIINGDLVFPAPAGRAVVVGGVFHAAEHSFEGEIGERAVERPGVFLQPPCRVQGTEHVPRNVRAIVVERHL